MGKKIADRVYQGYSVYDWSAYSKKFGFCDIEPVINSEAISKYITKYINKDLGSSVTSLGAHMYYHSRGLSRASVVSHGFLMHELDYDFEGEFCKSAWLDYSDELLDTLISGCVSLV